MHLNLNCLYFIFLDSKVQKRVLDYSNTFVDMEIHPILHNPKMYYGNIFWIFRLCNLEYIFGLHNLEIYCGLYN